MINKTFPKFINFRVELNNAWEQIKNLKEDINELSAEEKRLHKVILVSNKNL